MSAEIVTSSEFRGFLLEAKQHGYGAPDANVEFARGGAKEIWYGDADPFLYVDRFVGGNPYCGYEAVSYGGEGVESPHDIKPIWGMSYYETEFDRRYLTAGRIAEILGTVLPRPDMGLPLRGPSKTSFKLTEKGLVNYEFSPQRGSTLTRFAAEEVIRLDGRKVYAAKFMGGLVSAHP